ncbi:MAG: hypothetical protein RL059_1510 [Bacteroidota bacterium]
MSFTSGIFATQAQRVLQDTRMDIPANTNKAYSPKEKEFLAFARQVFSNQALPDIVTEEKVFAFLYYQAYRSKKKRGRKRKDTTMILFDVKEYDEVMANDQSDKVNMVGYDVVNQYLCAILKLWQSQVTDC